MRPDTFHFRFNTLQFISLLYISFLSFANSKTLANIVSKKIRCSFSDNIAISGVPTVTISSSVFSIFTPPFRLFLSGKKYPSIYRLENGKSRRSDVKISHNFYIRADFSFLSRNPTSRTESLIFKIIHYFLFKA